MKLLLDMNLSPQWVEVLTAQDLETRHWMSVGDADASDAAIMAWARTHDYVVVTHDLDFGALLAATRAEGPSVIQIRTQDVLARSFEETLIRILQNHRTILEHGALVTVEEHRARVRVLPFQS